MVSTLCNTFKFLLHVPWDTVVLATGTNNLLILHMYSNYMHKSYTKYKEAEEKNAMANDISN